MTAIEIINLNTLSNPQFAEFYSKEKQSNVISMTVRFNGVEVEKRQIAFSYLSKNNFLRFRKLNVSWPKGNGKFPSLKGLKTRFFLSRTRYDENSFPWLWNSGDKENPMYHIIMIGETIIDEKQYKGAYYDETIGFSDKPTEGVIWICPILFGDNPLVSECYRGKDLSYNRETNLIFIQQLKELTPSSISYEDLPDVEW